MRIQLDLQALGKHLTANHLQDSAQTSALKLLKQLPKTKLQELSVQQAAEQVRELWLS